MEKSKKGTPLTPTYRIRKQEGLLRSFWGDRKKPGESAVLEAKLIRYIQNERMGNWDNTTA